MRHVAVLVRQAPTGAKYLAAYVSAASGGTNLAIDSRELREWAASKLPDYMVPTTVTVLDKFPLTANGKLDRRALPEPDLAELSAHVAARNEVEQQFCTLIASQSASIRSALPTTSLHWAATASSRSHS